MPNENVKTVGFCQHCEMWQGVFPRVMFAPCARKPRTDPEVKTYCVHSCPDFLAKSKGEAAIPVPAATATITKELPAEAATDVDVEAPIKVPDDVVLAEEDHPEVQQAENAIRHFVSDESVVAEPVAEPVPEPPSPGVLLEVPMTTPPEPIVKPVVKPIVEETASTAGDLIDLDALSARVKEVVLQTDAMTWAELATWSENDIDDLDGCGPATLADLQTLLGERGLAFAEEEAEDDELEAYAEELAEDLKEQKVEEEDEPEA